MTWPPPSTCPASSVTRAGQRDTAAVEQRHPVAHALHLVEMVRGQQDRGAVGLERADHVEKFLRRVRVERGGRLVEDGDARPLHQDLGEPEPLAHALREGADPRRARHRPSPTRSSASANRSSISRRDKPGEPPGVGEVVARRQPVVKADLVGQIADPALHFERLAQRVEAGDLGAPAGRLGQPEQHQDRRRLARAVGPEDADDLAGADLEIDVVDRERRAVALGQRPRAAADRHQSAPAIAASPRPAQRRPKRATAKTTTRSAMAMIPIADRAPQGRGQHGDAEIGRFGQPARGAGADRRLVVAGDRALATGSASP